MTSADSRTTLPSEALVREVRRLALPAIVHSLLQTLVFVVDRVMLGHHGEASLAAMQIGGAVEWSIWSVFAAFEVGTVARVGRHVGAKDPSGARRVAWLSLAIAVVFGVLVALATPLVNAALPLLSDRVSPEAMAEARGYLGITIPATPLVFVAVTAVATLQAGGDTRTPLAIGVFANIVHVALNRVLILGAFGVVPPMGARGAAISTVVTFTLEAVLSVVALCSLSRPVSLRAQPNETRGSLREEVDALFRVGAPAFFERVVYHAGFIVYALVVTRLGDAAMAANQSLISVESICFLSADGFGIAAAALVAQKLGAGRPEDATRATKIAARDAVIALTVFGVGALLLRDRILPLFTTDAHVVGIGRATMPVLTLAQPFMALGIVLAQALRGAGRTRESFAVSLMGGLFVRLAATWVFVFGLGLGLPGVWLGSTTDWLVRAAALVVMLRRFGAAPRHAKS
jgi:MATE family multidrug resistance protein